MRGAASVGRAAGLERRLLRISTRLRRVYGRPRRRPIRPLDALVETVLSQNTSDVNSGRAFRALRRAYPRWQDAARALPREIERVIRCGGLARVKSRRILDVLERVRSREGRYSLQRLARMDDTQANAYLEGLPGVGPKTRACVLLFACGRHAFPVDTHVHRIALRQGLVARGASAAAAQSLLEASVPRGHALDLHLNLIRLGRAVCRARGPLCSECPIGAECPSWGRA